MNSAGTPAKKSALCRYFVSSGTCFYGSDCQFLHEAPRSRRNPMPNMPLDQAPAEGGDGNNGDQFFTATFGAPPVAVNGTPEFQPFFARNKSLRNGPVMNPGDDPRKAAAFMATGSLSPALDDSALNEQFATMSMSGQGKFQPGMKGRNPGALVFVPKSSTPQSAGSAGLTHSASTPSFSSYNSMNSAGLGGNVTASPQTLAQVVLADRSSPMGSPGLSPTGSPLVERRTKSPMTAAAAAEHAAAVAETLQVENVGGTTYFYTQDDLETPSGGSGVVFPNFTLYPGMLPHVAHMKPKANMPSFFMPDELKVEMLNRHTLTMAQLDPDLNTEMPHEVDTYHNLVPIEPPPASPMHKSSTFGYQTSVYKAINTKDGLTYCLRRIHGFRLVNTKCMALIDLWKKIQHSNIVQLREVFTTKAFSDHSMVFVYDFHPGANTLMLHHFCPPPPPMNGFSGRFNMEGNARPFSANKGGHNRQQQSNLLAESLIWSYVVQLSSALRTIHAHGLACRVMDPTKVLVTDKSRLRLNCLGIFDILSFDANQGNALAMMPHYQQEDLVSLGRVVLALACNSVSGIQREHIATSLELVARNYSADLKNLILYLLTNQSRLRSVNDIMPMIGARFYTQLDASQLRNDVLENEVGKEIENGRLYRLMCKLGTINDRPEFHMDPTWSETGDRYMLKLFRDYLFHQVDENGSPWIDMAHITQCLNKLDCGVPEKLCLMSRDEQSVLVVSYAELKHCFMTAFSELIQSSQSSQQAAFS